ncbi:PAP2 (acid phosphatase) superfamily protein [Cedecea neteri]|uniref:PAP2 (Acid phosphatase) superfamily protein n=1 Tax=Cedecea neteri TaxID=158822 RepID=A0A2X3KXX5_9ENTR|nr:hypothetical protein [Cedecea neteri]SQC91299.1 PAP2 (acid phosphatase) superfamily protein [Cedecea neteri]
MSNRRGFAAFLGQMMPRAHFFSHNLWTGWWIRFTQVALRGAILAWSVKAQDKS